VVKASSQLKHFLIFLVYLFPYRVVDNFRARAHFHIRGISISYVGGCPWGIVGQQGRQSQ
jgi:hypothetical protein